MASVMRSGNRYSGSRELHGHGLPQTLRTSRALPSTRTWGEVTWGEVTWGSSNKVQGRPVIITHAHFAKVHGLGLGHGMTLCFLHSIRSAECAHAGISAAHDCAMHKGS